MDNPESGFIPEYEFKEPTPQGVAEACSDTLDEETCEEIGDIDNLVDAIEFAFTALMEAGIDDPGAFLIEKGILLQ